MITGYSGATWIPSPNYGGLGDASHKRYVIVHGTAGMTSAANVAYWFANPTSQVSAHYVVGPAGEVVQCVDENEAAWAEGVVTGTPAPSGIAMPQYGDGVHRDPWWSLTLNPNLITISIEHVKPSLDNSDQLTPLQQGASFALIKDICKRWQIPMRAADGTGGITGHYSIDALNRARCPGPYPWSALFTSLLVESENIMLPIESASNSFTASADGRYWKSKFAYNPQTQQMEPSPTGAVLGHAILDFYRSYGGGTALTYLGLPIDNEVGVQGVNGATLQHFERGVVAYDPEHKIDDPRGSGSVYLLKLYDGGIGTDPRLTQLNQKYNALKQQLQQLQANSNPQTS